MSIYLSDFLERGGELPKVVEHNCEAIRQLDLYTQGARETARPILASEESRGFPQRGGQRVRRLATV